MSPTSTSRLAELERRMEAQEKRTAKLESDVAHRFRLMTEKVGDMGASLGQVLDCSEHILSELRTSVGTINGRLDTLGCLPKLPKKENDHA